MRLKDLTRGVAETCDRQATLREAARSMVAAATGSVGIVDRDRLVGILTERDVLRATAVGVDASSEPVDAWMTETPDVFSPNVDVIDAARWLLETGYRHLPVVDGDVLQGIVSMRAVLDAAVNHQQRQPAVPT